MQLADKCCAGRVVSVLEGGYKPDDLARCCAMHVRALAGAPSYIPRRGLAGSAPVTPSPVDDEPEAPKVKRVRAG